MVVFVVLRYVRIFMYFQGANLFHFGEATIPMLDAVMQAGSLTGFVGFVLAVFAISHYMLPFAKSFSSEITMIFDIGIMGNPDAQGLEGLDDTYSLNITDGTMTHEDAEYSPYHSFVFWFYLSFTLVVFFVLLNLVQGVLGEEYSSAKKDARPRFLRLRAQMVVNLLLLRECFGSESSVPETIVFVYENGVKSESEDEQTESELSNCSFRLPSPVPSSAPAPSNAHWSNATRDMAVQFHDGAQHYQFGNQFTHQGATPFNLQGVSSLNSAAHHLRPSFHQSGHNAFPPNGTHMA